MPMVRYRENGAATRIPARLGGDCPDYAQEQNRYMAAIESARTVPTRCITSVYWGGTQTAHGGVTNLVYRGQGASTQGRHDEEEENY